MTFGVVGHMDNISQALNAKPCRRKGGFPRLHDRRFADPVGTRVEPRAPLVNFLAIDGDAGRGGDPQPDLVALDLHYLDANVAVDHDFVAETPCENQHDHSSSVALKNKKAPPAHMCGPEELS
jgi:hypothetical protein